MPDQPINLTQLRERAEGCIDTYVGLGYGTIDVMVAPHEVLALLDLAEAAHAFRVDGLTLIGGGGRIERNIANLDDALTKFTWNE